MPAKPNVSKILATLGNYPWTKGGIYKEIEGKEHFDTIGMLLREIGIDSQEVRKLNMGTTWLRFGGELRAHYGIDAVDYYLVLIAGDSSASASDMLSRVESVLNGNTAAVAPFYRTWIDSLVANREQVNADSDKVLARFPVRQLPDFIVRLGEKDDPAVQVSKLVWSQKEDFVRWPNRSYKFWQGVKRAKATGRKTTYTYPSEQLKAITDAGLIPRAWTNDPAIYAFKIAGGERPLRSDGKWEWSVHHIYDGKFPAIPGGASTHAVKDTDHFTEAAGLVAVHPIADALASEVPYFAWMLRFEAFCRFDGFDPDGVFANLK